MCQRNVRDRECAVLPEMESEETAQEGVRGSDSLGCQPYRVQLRSSWH
jgi:hypothetical protein